MPIGTNWCPKVTQRIPALECAEQAFAMASVITSELSVQRTSRPVVAPYENLAPADALDS
jgi:hypothetical protein